jgi:hypothetical protein
MNLTRLLKTLAANSKEKPGAKKISNPSIMSMHKGIRNRIKSKKGHIFYDGSEKTKGGKVLHSYLAAGGNASHLQEYLKKKGFKQTRKGNEHSGLVTRYTHPNGVRVRHIVKSPRGSETGSFSLFRITKK